MEQKNQAKSRFMECRGKTMGTHYHVQYFDEQNRDLSASIDSILHLLDKKQLSTYSEESTLSQFNRSQGRVALSVQEDFHFIQNLLKGKSVYDWSRGFFDPTVFPLVNYWGFGVNPRENGNRDSSEVLSLLEQVGFSKLEIERKPDSIIVWKPAEITLDFSAIAKGYSAEQVGIYLRSLGIHDLYVEVGGELCLAGKNPKGENWRIGVNLPSVEAEMDEIYQVLSLSDHCVASSGNYRNYYKENGRILSHTINPKTGYPERNSLLSATVIGSDGAITDAMATAAMVMGWRPFLKMIEKRKKMECYLIYSTANGEMRDTLSTGAHKYLLH